MNTVHRFLLTFATLLSFSIPSFVCAAHTPDEKDFLRVFGSTESCQSALQNDPSLTLTSIYPDNRLNSIYSASLSKGVEFKISIDPWDDKHISLGLKNQDPLIKIFFSRKLIVSYKFDGYSWDRNILLFEDLDQQKHLASIFTGSFDPWGPDHQQQLYEMDMFYKTLQGVTSDPHSIYSDDQREFASCALSILSLFDPNQE
ncbi:MAG: hypothetical protein KDD52_06000 [Bdellovibrionales bacterium]|nr:hypothetical protein [Bdellovibrionales bacterium]